MCAIHEKTDSWVLVVRLQSSADTRQLFPRQHIQGASATDAYRRKRLRACRSFDASDDGCIGVETAKNGRRFVRRHPPAPRRRTAPRSRHKADRTREFHKHPRTGSDIGNRRLFQSNSPTFPTSAISINAVAKTTPGEIAQAMQFDSSFDEFRTGAASGAQSLVIGRLESKPFASGHDGDAVTADIAAQYDRVARADLLRRDRQRRGMSPTPDVLI